MRKVNGFTLLEILAVVIILGIIAIVTTIYINDIMNNSRDSLNESQKELILDSAKKWGNFHDEALPMEGTCTLPVSQLADDGYIDSDDIIDPTTNKEIPVCIEITYNDGKYSYKYTEKTCEHTCK